jgi:hypothetical protein
MSKSETTDACPVCHARFDERCLARSSETCPQPWREKGPRPVVADRPTNSQTTRKPRPRAIDDMTQAEVRAMFDEALRTNTPLNIGLRIPTKPQRRKGKKGALHV